MQSSYYQWRCNDSGIGVDEIKLISLVRPYDKRLFLKLPKPKNLIELEILSDYIFGKSVHLRSLLYDDGPDGSFQTIEAPSTYLDTSFINSLKYRLDLSDEYTLETAFWELVLGRVSLPITTIKQRYRRFSTLSYRQHLRVKNLKESILGRQRFTKSFHISEPFTRLAREVAQRRGNLGIGQAILPTDPGGNEAKDTQSDMDWEEVFVLI